jgi:hypothetical protein
VKRLILIDKPFFITWLTLKATLLIMRASIVVVLSFWCWLNKKSSRKEWLSFDFIAAFF